MSYLGAIEVARCSRCLTTDDATGPEEDDDQNYVMNIGLDRDLGGLGTQLLFVSSDGVFLLLFPL
jgi:hypothetical protein